MKRIDESRLEADPQYRFEYLSEFPSFDEDDVAAIHASAGHLAPLIPGIVDQTYDRLLQYDATARHFVPRQHGFDGSLPLSVEDLSANHEQIQFRKEHLSRYLMQLVGHAYNEKMTTYLDMVGKIHTPKSGNRAIEVSLVQMNALMGLISDVLTETILGLNIDATLRRGLHEHESKVRRPDGKNPRPGVSRVSRPVSLAR